MWKVLKPGDTLQIGNTIRMSAVSYPVGSDAITYEVIKTDLHYFEIIRENNDHSLLLKVDNKIIRYTDIGYYLFIEVWVGQSVDLKTEKAQISY